MPPTGAEQLQWMLGVEDDISGPLAGLTSKVDVFMDKMDALITSTDKSTQNFSNTVNDLTFGTAPKAEAALMDMSHGAQVWIDKLNATTATQQDMAKTLGVVAQSIDVLADSAQKGGDKIAKATGDVEEAAEKGTKTTGKFVESMKQGKKAATRFAFSLEDVGVSFEDVAKIVAAITIAGLITGFFKKIAQAQQESFERGRAWHDQLISMPRAVRSTVQSLSSLEYYMGATNDELAELGTTIAGYSDLTKTTDSTATSLREMTMRSLQVSRAMNISSTSAFQLLTRLGDMNKLGPKAAMGVASAFDHVAKATSLSGEAVAEMGGNVAREMSFLQNNLEETMGTGAKRAAAVTIAEMTAAGGAIADEFGEVDLSAWMKGLRDESTRRSMFAAISRIAGVAPEALEEQFQRGDISEIFLKMIEGTKIRKEDVGIDQFRRDFGSFSEQLGLDAESMEQLLRVNVTKMRGQMAEAVHAMDHPTVQRAGKATMTAWQAAWEKFERTIEKFYNEVGQPFMETFIKGFQWGLAKIQPPLMKFAKSIKALEIDEKLTKWWTKPKGGQVMFSEMKFAITDTLIPALKKLWKGIKVVADWYGNLTDDNKKLVHRISALTAAAILLSDTIVGKAVKSLMKFAWTITKFVITSVFKMAAAITRVAVVSLWEMTWTLLKGGVPALVTFAWNILKTVVPALLTFAYSVLSTTIPALVGMATSIFTLNIPAFFGFVGSLIAGVIPAMVTFVGTILTGALPALAALATAFIPILIAIAPFLLALGAIAYLGYVIYDNWKDIKIVFGGFFAEISRWLDETFPRLSKFLGWITGAGEELTKAGRESQPQIAPPPPEAREEGFMEKLTGEGGLLSGLTSKLGIDIPKIPEVSVQPGTLTGLPVATAQMPGTEQKPVEIDDARIVDVLDTIKRILENGFDENVAALNRRSRKASPDAALIASLAPSE